MIEQLLKLFVGVVDAQLFKRVELQHIQLQQPLNTAIHRKPITNSLAAFKDTAATNQERCNDCFCKRLLCCIVTALQCILSQFQQSLHPSQKRGHNALVLVSFSAVMKLTMQDNEPIISRCIKDTWKLLKPIGCPSVTSVSYINNILYHTLNKQ